MMLLMSETLLLDPGAERADRWLDDVAGALAWDAPGEDEPMHFEHTAPEQAIGVEHAYFTTLRPVLADAY